MHARPIARIAAFASLLTVAGCGAKTDAGEHDGKAAPSEPVAAADGEADPEASGTQSEADRGPTEGKRGLASTVAEQVEKARIGEEDKPVVKPGEAVVAKVGEVELPKSAFDEIYDLKVKKYTERGRDIPASAAYRYRASILRRLVLNELLRQAAANKGVDYDRAELLRRSEQQKRGIKDWETHLERRGETEESLQAMYIAELREKALLEAEGALEPSKADIEAEYEKIRGNWESDQPRYRASHILVPIGDAPESGAVAPELTPEEQAVAKKEAQARAAELYKEATVPGADFAELARTRSTGPSASKGGDLGIFTTDRMVEEFSNKVAAMKVGEISEPVLTKFGFHIIKVTGSWPAGELPLSALEDQIRERLFQRNLHQGRRELQDRLQAQTKVVWFMEPEGGEMVAAGIDPPEQETKEEAKKADSKFDPYDKADLPYAPSLGITEEAKAETKSEMKQAEP